MTFQPAKIELQGDALVVKNDEGYAVVVENIGMKADRIRDIFGDEVQG